MIVTAMVAAWLQFAGGWVSPSARTAKPVRPMAPSGISQANSADNSKGPPRTPLWKAEPFTLTARAAHGKITRNQAVQPSGLSSDQVSRALRRLVAVGKLAHVGANKGRGYTLPANPVH